MAKKRRLVQGTYIRTKIKTAIEEEANRREITPTRLASELLEAAVQDLEKKGVPQDGQDR